MHRPNRANRTACYRQQSNPATVAPFASVAKLKQAYLGLGHGRLFLASGVAARVPGTYRHFREIDTSTEATESADRKRSNWPCRRLLAQSRTRW